MALDPRSTDRSASSFGPGQTPRAFACHLRQGGPSRMFARTLRVLDRLRRAVLVRRPDHALGNGPATMDQPEVDKLAVADGGGAPSHDRDDDALRRLVPAFYSTY